MKQFIICPLCTKNAGLRHRKESIAWRGKQYAITYHSYYCLNCKVFFSTKESDLENLSQIPDYIEKSAG